MIAPPIAPEALSLFRTAYGALMLLTLAHLLPQARRFFLSERFGGYADTSVWSLALHNPVMMPVSLLLWALCATAFVADRYVVPAALVNLLLCRYFFISMRWKGILRGMGAPGFIAYWHAALLFFLELGARYDASGRILEAASAAFRIDMGVIMICAGTYKAVAGYPRNEGMELGMVSPFWGYWGRLYRRLRPSHPTFHVLNHLAYGVEIVAGLMMLFPPTQFWGGLGIFLSFAWILTHIRLSWLCETLMAGCLVYIPRGHLVASFLPAATYPRLEGTAPEWVVSAVVAFLWGYVTLLPFAKFGQWYNFLAEKRLPGPFQRLLERYTNAFGIIIWRVFSVDVTNFYIRILVQDREGRRQVYSRPGVFDPAVSFRYTHVAEFICVTTLFTTLKYYPANDRLFVERVTRYARTVPCPPEGRVVFEYVALHKEGDRFGERLVSEFVVDPVARTVEERVIDPAFSVRSASPVSPVHAGVTPGSYAPA